MSTQINTNIVISHTDIPICNLQKPIIIESFKRKLFWQFDAGSFNIFDSKCFNLTDVSILSLTNIEKAAYCEWVYKNYKFCNFTDDQYHQIVNRCFPFYSTELTPNSEY